MEWTFVPSTLFARGLRIASGICYWRVQEKKRMLEGIFDYCLRKVARTIKWTGSNNVKCIRAKNADMANYESSFSCLHLVTPGSRWSQSFHSDDRGSKKLSARKHTWRRWMSVAFSEDTSLLYPRQCVKMFINIQKLDFSVGREKTAHSHKFVRFSRLDMSVFSCSAKRMRHIQSGPHPEYEIRKANTFLHTSIEWCLLNAEHRCRRMENALSKNIQFFQGHEWRSSILGYREATGEKFMNLCWLMLMVVTCVNMYLYTTTHRLYMSLYFLLSLFDRVKHLFIFFFEFWNELQHKSKQRKNAYKLCKSLLFPRFFVLLFYAFCDHHLHRWIYSFGIRNLVF